MKIINDLFERDISKRITEEDIIAAYDSYYFIQKEEYFSVLSRIWNDYNWSFNFELNLYWDVNPMDYDTMHDYLDVLRKKWKEEFDSHDKYYSIWLDDFDSYEEYLNAIREKKSWREKYDSENQFDINPFDFYDLDDYLGVLHDKWFEKWLEERNPDYNFCDENYWPDVSADDFDCYEEYERTLKQAFLDIKKSWQEKYDPGNQFDVKLCEFYDLDSYLDVLRKKWEEKWGSEYYYLDVSVDDFDCYEEYERTLKQAIIDEKDSWQEKYDSGNQFDVNPFDFYDLDSYLDALRKKWIEKYDSEYYCLDVCVDDFDSFTEYAKAIKQAIKNEKSKTGIGQKMAYSNFKKINLLCQNIYVEFNGISKQSETSFIIDLVVDNQNVFPIGLSLYDVTINGKQVDLKNNDLIVYSKSLGFSTESGCFEFNPNDFEYIESTTIHTIQFNLDIGKLIMSREAFINTKITLNF